MRKVKKYVITGGPCSGKSSLIDELDKRGYVTIKEVAREIISKRLDNSLTTEEFRIRQSLIYDEQLKRENSLISNISFLDRSLIDSLFYSKMQTGTIPERFFENDLNERYNGVFVLEILTFVKDELRIEKDEKEARSNHLQLIEFYKKQLPFIIIHHFSWILQATFQ